MIGPDALSLQSMMDMVGLHALIFLEINFINWLLEMKIFQKILRLPLKMELQKLKKCFWNGRINKVDLMKIS